MIVMNAIREISKRVIQNEMLKWLPDKPYIKLLYWTYMGKRLNLKNPVTYNEKLQWLKLYDRKPVYTQMVDKYTVKQFVANIIGEQYIIPTLGVWEKPEEIDFEILPDKFVLKSTHDSGGIQIVDKRNNFDRNLIIKFFRRRLSQGTYNKQREWPYKNVHPRIIAEEYMEDDLTQELRDYKFFCFNGEVKALFIATDRQSEKPTAFDFFDSEFNWIDLRHGHPNAKMRPEKPNNFEQMKIIASKLSQGFPQLRVDLYEINGKVYFGELTFFHHGGIVRFDPDEWDYRFGEWIHLPHAEKERHSL